MNKIKTMGIIISIALLTFLFYFLFLFKPLPSKNVVAPKSQFINPDLIFGNKNKPFIYLNYEENPDFIESNGFYVYGPVDEDYGIIVLHPISRDIPRYLGTFLLLNDTNKRYILQIKVGNIAGKISFAEPTQCNDNIFEILLSDIFESGDTYLLEKIEVNSNDGWVYKEYDLTNLKGKNYYLVILSKAGGKCGNWNGEWGAVSYLNLKEE